MSRCPHCKGTGEVPDKIEQECIGCQRKVTITWDADRAAGYDGRVYCRDCKPLAQPPLGQTR